MPRLSVTCCSPCPLDRETPALPAGLPSHRAVPSAVPPAELFAVTFCVLLLSCKDLVGYVFTKDR